MVPPGSMTPLPAAGETHSSILEGARHCLQPVLPSSSAPSSCGDTAAPACSSHTPWGRTREFLQPEPRNSCCWNQGIPSARTKEFPLPEPKSSHSQNPVIPTANTKRLPPEPSNPHCQDPRHSHCQNQGIQATGTQQFPVPEPRDSHCQNPAIPTARTFPFPALRSLPASLCRSTMCSCPCRAIPTRQGQAGAAPNAWMRCWKCRTSWEQPKGLGLGAQGLIHVWEG